MTKKKGKNKRSGSSCYTKQMTPRKKARKNRIYLAERRRQIALLLDKNSRQKAKERH